MNTPDLEPHQQVVSALSIAERLPVLAQEIIQAYGESLEGIVIVPVMTGAFIFAADLVRRLPDRVHVDAITVRSYGGGTVSKGPRIDGAMPGIIGRHVLLVDDILDSGRTINYLRQEMLDRGAASVRACVLLRKMIPAAMHTPCEFIGFDIPDLFVAGYGLDYDGWFRNLPEVVSLRKCAETSAVVR